MCVGYSYNELMNKKYIEERKEEEKKRKREKREEENKGKSWYLYTFFYLKSGEFYLI